MLDPENKEIRIGIPLLRSEADDQGVSDHGIPIMSFVELAANEELYRLWQKSLKETWTPRLPGYGKSGGPLILSNDGLYT